MPMPIEQATQQQVDPMQQQQMQQRQMMMEQIRSLPPEEQEAALMRLFQDYQGQEGVLDAQMAQAQGLRDQGQPQGQQVGNQFVASNPLSNILAGVGQAKGGIDNRQAIAAKKALSDQRTEGQTDVARQQMQQPQAQPQQMQQQGITAEMLRRYERYGIDPNLAAGQQQNANQLNY